MIIKQRKKQKTVQKEKKNPFELYETKKIKSIYLNQVLIETFKDLFQALHIPITDEQERKYSTIRFITLNWFDICGENTMTMSFQYSFRFDCPALRKEIENQLKNIEEIQEILISSNQNIVIIFPPNRVLNSPKGLSLFIYIHTNNANKKLKSCQKNQNHL